MLLAKRSRKRRDAAASVELALLLPLLITCMLGIWEMGRMVDVQQIVSNGAREAGRMASTSNMSNTAVISATRDYLKRAGLPTAAGDNAIITIVNKDSGLDAVSANQLDRFEITIKVYYNDVRWVNLNLNANSSTDPTTATFITAISDWYSMNDTPLTVDQAVPVS
jgi:Flp pilus assembly protein TadG